MAEEQAPASTSNVEENEMAWVADEPRNTISKFSLTGGSGMFKTVQHPPLDDWKACVPSLHRRICSKYQWGSFPMYQIVFEHMGYRLPFSDFEVAVFRHLYLTPSQLHPNFLAFIRAFEMTAVYLGFMPTIPLFFHAFHLQRSKPKGDAEHKHGWVSLKQSVKLFDMGPAKDATGAPLLGPDSRPVLDNYSRFPLSWMQSHYHKPASDFVYSAEELTIEELSNYEDFGDGIPLKSVRGRGWESFAPRIWGPYHKEKLYRYQKVVEEMSTIAAKLRKSKANKEKRQAAGFGSSPTTAPPPTPGGDGVETLVSRPVVMDLENDGGHAVDNPRPSKVSRVDEANASVSGRVPSTLPRYVLSPAIGSPGLVKKSSVALSDVETTIMDDMGPEALKNELADAMVAAFKLMEISSYLNGRECKYLDERDAGREEVIAANQRLEQTKVNHAAYREKHKLQAGILTKLDEKEAEAARLTKEKEELKGQIKDLTADKITLEGKVKELDSKPCSSTTAPDPEELVVDPNGEYKGFTRAALISRIFELEGQKLSIAKSSFDNAAAQLLVLNPGVDLVTEGASELKEV
ncbi:hypothetical protein TSUD_04230 [Trifolium subterraneum]|nr:hypothetical protein TSUD_04230 [Trifolium subterraneum]